MSEALNPEPDWAIKRDDGDRLGRLLAAGMFVFGRVAADPPPRPDALDAKPLGAEPDPR